MKQKAPHKPHETSATSSSWKELLKTCPRKKSEYNKIDQKETNSNNAHCWVHTQNCCLMNFNVKSSTILHKICR